MTSNNDNRQTKTQLQLTPTHTLERAIDQLPPDERPKRTLTEAAATLACRGVEPREVG